MEILYSYKIYNMFSSNHNRFSKPTENKFGNVPHISRLNLETLNATPLQPIPEHVSNEWDKLEISEEEYYDNVVQPIPVLALELEKQISDIIEVDDDNIEDIPIVENVGESNENELTFENIYINNQDDNIEFEEDAPKPKRRSKNIVKSLLKDFKPTFRKKPTKKK